MKNHDQKALGKERAYLAYTLALLFITKGSQAETQTGQDPEAGANAEGIEGASYWLPSHGLLSPLYYRNQGKQSRNDTTIGWALPLDH